MKRQVDQPRRRGRPPGFDRDAVLEKAAGAFWQHGYEGASIVDLTSAMGITAQSLYAAFGSKADLYREAIDWYRSHVGIATAEALEDPDAVTALRRVLDVSAREFTRPGRPNGCMISTAILGCAEENVPMADYVAGLRNRTIAALEARIARGVAEGQLVPATNAKGMARFVGALIQGMSVQARDGASLDQLRSLAEPALAEFERHRRFK